MTTVRKVMDIHRGIGPGFDFLRIALALLILFTHSGDIVTGEYDEYSVGPWLVPVRSLVPMFFVLSGFLVTGSAQRLRLKDFILNRAMRIIPALAVDVIVAACIIGPIFTNLTLSEYLHNGQFWSYFSNIIGIINYTLPGVFVNNINPNTVNGSLWTVPFEIGCYVIMSVVMLMGLLAHRYIFVVFTFVLCLTVNGFVFLLNRDAQIELINAKSHVTHFLMTALANKAGSYLYLYFLAGCLSNLFKEMIPVRFDIFLISICIIVLTSIAGFYYPGLTLTKMIMIAPFLTYLTIYIGMIDIPKLPIFGRGDYSYGIYLYGFPLQQALVASFPGYFTVTTHYICSVLVTTSVAMVSWHFIEKPVLKFRNKFSFMKAVKNDDGQHITSSASVSRQEHSKAVNRKYNSI